MKLIVKRFLFCLTVVIGIVATFLLCKPLHTHTDLMSLMNISGTQEQWPTNKITDKFSSVINIVTESTDEKTALKSAQKTQKLLLQEQFNTFNVQYNNLSLKEITKDLIPYKNGLLSNNNRILLQQKNSRKIANDAIKQVSQSMMPPMVPLREDPFLLLSDYILNINSGNSAWTLNNGILWQYKDSKHYFMIPVDVDMTNATLAAKQINLLRKKLSNQKDENVKIYVSGIPVHTATMVEKSQMEISILSLLAIMTAILFSYLLFKRIFTLITVITSLTIGFLCGAIALFLCFGTPHILTFVFGTTLIGLGIDYSFHFLTGATLKNQTQIKTNMRHSFLTTLVCFLPLLFSGVSLLQQISVFTIVGLTTVYIGLNLFIPNKLEFKTKPLNIDISWSKKTKNIILFLIGIVIAATLPFVKFENNMNQLYRPDSQILAQDATIQNLNNSQQSNILMIRGKDIQSVLETEENIKQDGVKFFSLSNIIPSIKTQQENQKLIKELYTKQSKYLKQKLELKNTPVFAESQYTTPNNITSPFIKNWVNKLIFQDNDYVYSLAQISPDTKISNDNAMVVSVSQTLSNQIEKYSHTTYKLLAICAICLMVLLSIFYKKRAIIYLIPSVLAILMSVCILTWFNQPITFFHMLSFFIVTGLGLDYTIFNINTKDSAEMRPILFSFLTSFIGFGLLAFTSFFLIKSMGITLGLGLGLSYLISLFLFRTNKTNTNSIC